MTPFTLFLLSLCVGKFPDTLSVSAVRPTVLSSLGHRRITLEGEGLHPYETKVFLNGVALDVDNKTSDPRGKSIAVTLPSLAHMENADVLRITVTADRTGQEHEVDSSLFEVSAEHTVSTPAPTTAITVEAGSTFALPTLSHEVDPAHLVAFLDGHEVRAYTPDDKSSWFGHVATRDPVMRLPNAVTAGTHDLADLNDISKGRMDVNMRITVIPVVTHVEETDGSIKILGAGFNARAEGMKVESCDIVKADHHVIEAECPSGVPEQTKLTVNGMEAACRGEGACHPVPVTAHYGNREPMPVHDLTLPIMPPSDRRRLEMPSGSVRWSSWKSNCPSKYSDCTIPAGTTVFLDESMEVRVLYVEGTLVWDTETDNIVLKADSVVVRKNGYFKLDQVNANADTRATIYIKNGAETDIGKRVFGHMSFGGDNARIHVHGKPMKYTWGLLVEDANPGDTSITLDRDVSDWRAGDRVVVANTGLTDQKPEFAPEEFVVDRVTGNKVYFTAAFGQWHLGNAEKQFQAEVINLSRRVVITGDDFDSDKHGLHTIGAGGGEMQISYTRVEKCGQRGILARYCLHFHHMHDAPTSHFIGNAVEEGHQRGITIHGTHHSLTKDNVVYQVRGAYLYVEDGNEIYNRIEDNVMICHDNSRGRPDCRAVGTDNPNSDDWYQSAIWTLSATNDYIGNRGVNHEIGFFIHTSPFPYGKGGSAGKVCTNHTPFGKFQRNVLHSNTRFGFYPDSNFPRDLDRDVESNGQVREDADGKMSSCNALKDDGSDNGVVGTVEDGLDWGNAYVGQYHCGDVQYLRHRSVNNVNNMYWKTTKNFADGRVGHLKECTIGHDENLIPGIKSLGFGVNIALLLAPGGLGAFVIEDTKFFGRGPAIASNHHCNHLAGVMCTPQYDLRNVDFSEMRSDATYFRFGSEGGEPTLGIFTTSDGSIGGGVRSVLHSAHAHLLTLPNAVCQTAASAGLENRIKEPSSPSHWDAAPNAVVCTQPARRLNIWTNNQSLKMRAPGGGLSSTLTFVEHKDARIPTRMGLGTPIVLPPSGVSKSAWKYEIVGNLEWDKTKLGRVSYDSSSWGPDVTVEFSDDITGFENEEIELVINGQSCTARSDDSRLYIGIEGPMRTKVGSCTELNPLPEPPAPTYRPTPPALEYQGCFDEPNGQTYTKIGGGQNSPSRCSAECVEGKYQYAYLNYFFNCACSNTLPTVTADESKCSTSCEGDRSIMCGGTGRVSVYKLGFGGGEDSPVPTPTPAPEPATTTTAPVTPSPATPTPAPQPGTKQYCLPKQSKLGGLSGALWWVCDSNQSGVDCDDTPTTCSSTDDQAAWAMSKYYALKSGDGGSCDFSDSAELTTSTTVTKTACVYGYQPPKTYCVPKSNPPSLSGALGWACSSSSALGNGGCNDTPSDCTSDEDKASWAFSKFFHLYASRGDTCDFGGNAEISSNVNANCVYNGRRRFESDHLPAPAL